MATSSDYAWVESSPFGVAYCLTMVEGLTPHEMFDRLDVLERDDLTGLEGLAEAPTTCMTVGGSTSACAMSGTGA
jgi:hypothetical protein